MDFNTWLEETKAALAAIAADVAVLGERLSAVEQKTTAYLDEVSHFAEDAKISEGRGSAISRNANVAALIRKSVSMLQHDVEVIIAKDYLFRRAGIDLDHLVERYVGEFGSWIEQDGTARVESQSANPCDITVEGQNSVAVPLKVEILGSVETTSVHVNFAPLFPVAGVPRIAVRLTRLPSACSTDVPTALSVQIEERAQVTLSQLLTPVVVDLPQIDFLPTSARFSVTWIDDFLRCLGSHARRQRRRRPLLKAPADGYAIGVKLDREFVWQVVRTEVTRFGATIFGGPTVTSQRSFSISAGFLESGSVKAGCDLVRWTVRVSVNIAFDILVRNERMLVITGRQVGNPDVSIDIDPDLLDWLLGFLKDKVAQYIRDRVPSLGTIEKRFWVNSARQLDAVFWEEFIVFSINV